MSVLSDKDIKKYIESGKLVIKGDVKIDPCSVDLRLGNNFRVFRSTEITYIDTKKGVDERHMETVEKKDDEAFVIHPHELVLATTKESIKIPNDLVATLDGRSSLGRLGIVIHSTANSFDPGFEGFLTLEISNISKVPVKLWPGLRVCRLTFTKLSSPCDTDYGQRKESKYSKQEGPEASRIGMD